MQVSTFLWFDGRAEEAAEHYTGLFADGEVLDVQRAADGTAATVTFALGGQRFVAYDGGPRFAFTPAVSLYVECDTQAEVDDLWAALTDGGEVGPGGSLVDRFGVTWQVIPRALGEILESAEPYTAERVLETLHAMTRIDIQGLVDARDR